MPSSPLRLSFRYYRLPSSCHADAAIRHARLRFAAFDFRCLFRQRAACCCCFHFYAVFAEEACTLHTASVMSALFPHAAFDAFSFRRFLLISPFDFRL